MSRHVKQKYFKVGLDKGDAAALRELARRESERRKDPELGAATLLREYSMPMVHARLAELKTLDNESVPAGDRRADPTDRREVERRAGDRRHEPVEVSS